MRNNTGLGLPGILVASALLGILTLGAMGFLRFLNQGVIGNRIVASRDNLRNQVEKYISNHSVLVRSAQLASNSAFSACYLGSASLGCPAGVNQPFSLIDPADKTNNTILSGTATSPKYFDTQGSPCEGPSPGCLLELYTTFTSDCGGPANCNKAVSVTVDYTLRQVAGVSAPGPRLKAVTRSLAATGSSDIPVGAVQAFAGTTVPQGWLECNGNAISRTTYVSLFTVLGTTYGTGDGSTSFNLPDLRGEFIRGWDNGRGVDASRLAGTFQSHQFENHKHYSMAFSNSPQFSAGSGFTRFYFPNTSGYTNAETTDPTSGNYGAETRPRNISMMYIIKY